MSARGSLLLTLWFCAIAEPALAGRPPPPPGEAGEPVFSVEPWMDRAGADYRTFDLPSPDLALCLRACADDPKCLAYTYADPGLVSPQARCFLKSAAPAVSRKAGCTSGARTGRTAPRGEAQRFSIEPARDRAGADFRVFDLPVPDVEPCRRACAAEARCLAYTYADPGLVSATARCFLKGAAQPATDKPGCTSGLRGGLATALPERPLIADPPRPRNEPAVRDCGTGLDDPGCQELRDGRWALDAAAWRDVLAVVRAERNELSRRDLTVEAVGDRLLTTRQFTALLDTLGNELTRLELARSLVPHVVDPQRALGYASRFNNATNRREFVEALRPPSE